MKKVDLLNIVVADDQVLFRNALALAVRELPMVGQVLEAGNGVEVMEILSREKIDVILLDLQMPEMNGFETCVQIQTRKLNVKIILLSMLINGHNEILLRQCGAHATLSKDVDFEELESTIIRVAGDVLGEVESKATSGFPFNLSDREVEVMELIVKGLTSKEIALALSISKRTVDSRRDCLYKKIGAKNSSEAIFIAQKYFSRASKQ